MKNVILSRYDQNRSSINFDVLELFLRAINEGDRLDIVVENSFAKLRQYNNDSSIICVEFQNSGAYIASYHDDFFRIKKDQVDPLLRLHESIPHARVIGLYDFRNAAYLARKLGIQAFYFPDPDDSNTHLKIAGEISNLTYQR